MATLTTTPIKTFVSGETVTPTKLNELSQSAVALTAGTIVDADVSASAAIALSKLATGALPAAITVASANLVDGTIATADVADAAITPAKLSQPYTLATAQASTSGTSIDFTGIPSWAKRITVMFDGVSTNGTSSILLRLGDSGGFETSGYISVSSTVITSSAGADHSTVGFLLTGTGLEAAGIYSGTCVLTLLSGNSWTQCGCLGAILNNRSLSSSGSKTLSDTLTQVRITTVNGTDTFDAGTVNIAYEA